MLEHISRNGRRRKVRAAAERIKVEDEVTDSHAWTRAGVGRGREDAVGQVLDWERTFGVVGHERGGRGCCVGHGGGKGGDLGEFLGEMGAKGPCRRGL